MHNLIGLGGLKRSGKDTAAKALIADGWTKMAFADSLRRSLEILDPYIGEVSAGWSLRDRDGLHEMTRMIRLSEALARYGGWEGLKSSPFAAEARRLLQTMGNDVGRDHLHPSLWVNSVFYARERYGIERLVIPDVRYINEADQIHAEGGIVILVQRDGVDEGDQHASEVIDYDYDYIVPNNGTVAELHEAIRTIANRK